MAALSDSSNSGIYVVEGLSREQGIPVDRATTVAFVGPTPRGPIDRPLKLTSAADFLKNFAAPGQRCRLELAIQQYFACGGQNALVVRVSATRNRNLIELPGREGPLVLQAINPGPYEYLRASIDYDGITEADANSFNMVVQRLRSPIEPFIYEQEIFSDISVDENSDQFVGHALMQSDLVTSLEPIPAARPAETISSNSIRSVSYIDCRSGSQPASPSDYDLIGSATEGTGLFALEQAECIDLLCLFSAAPKEDLGPVAVLAADRYCRSKQALLLVDPPLHWMSVADVVTAQHPPGFSSPNLLTYFPRLQARSGVVSTPVSAMGALAGVLAARDRQVGRDSGTPGKLFFKRGAYKPAVNLTADDIQSLARLGINSLVRAPRLHVRVEGEVTLARYSSITSEWGELHLRRKALFILGSISSCTNWLAFQENESPVWQELGEQLHPFMQSLHERGYLAGDSPSNAYFVKCDSDSNFGLTGRKGEFAFIVGFALRKSGDHQVFRFSHRDGTCTISELGWRTGLALAS